MMRMAVIDDEKYSRSELIHQIREVLPQAEVLEAANGAQGLKLLDRNSFDLLFIDIHLGDMEGTTVASLARKINPKAKIVFATAYSEYAVRAFELQIDDYILKPFDPCRIRQVIHRLVGENSGTASVSPALSPTRLAVTSSRRTVLLNLDSILYIETDGSGRGCILHTLEERYNDNTTLGEYESRLSPYGFYRIHKTCLVQLKHIQDIFSWTNNGFALRMQGRSDILPIGRERLKGLRQRLEI